MGARPFFSRAAAAFQKSARLGITTHQRPSPHRVRRAHPQQGRPDDDGRAADGRDYPARPRCAPLQHTHSRRTHTHTLHQAHLLLSPLASAGTVPDEIKSELLQKIRRFAEAQS